MTILEIAISAVLLLVTLIAFLSIRQRQAKVKEANVCVEKQWNWNRGFEEIEAMARRWEMLAPHCLVTGFTPFSKTEDGNLQIIDIDRSYPVLALMNYDDRVVTTNSHSFFSQDKIILCSIYDFGFAHADKTKASSAEGTEVIMLNFDEGYAGKRFQKGDLLAEYTIATFEEVTSKATQSKTLLVKEGDSPPREIARLYEEFSFELSEPFLEAPRLSLKFEDGDCELEKEIFLSKDEPPPAMLADWFIRDGKIVVEPWLIDGEQTP